MLVLCGPRNPPLAVLLTPQTPRFSIRARGGARDGSARTLVDSVVNLRKPPLAQISARACTRAKGRAEESVSCEGERPAARYGNAGTGLLVGLETGVLDA